MHATHSQTYKHTHTHKQHKIVLKATEKADSESTKMLWHLTPQKQIIDIITAFNLAVWAASNITCVILLATHRVKLLKIKTYVLKNSFFYELWYFCDVNQLCLKYLIVLNSWNIKHTFTSSVYKLSHVCYLNFKRRQIVYV